MSRDYGGKSGRRSISHFVVFYVCFVNVPIRLNPLSIKCQDARVSVILPLKCVSDIYASLCSVIFMFATLVRVLFSPIKWSGSGSDFCRTFFIFDSEIDNNLAFNILSHNL